MTDEKPANGTFGVHIAGTKEDPLIELEFYPEEGDCVGIRLRPAGAMTVACELAAALVELDWVSDQPDRTDQTDRPDQTERTLQ